MIEYRDKRSLFAFRICFSVDDFIMPLNEDSEWEKRFTPRESYLIENINNKEKKTNK